MSKKHIFQGFAAIGFIALVIVMVNTTDKDRNSIELVGNPSTGYTWVIQDFDSQYFDVREDITYMGDVGVVGADSLYLYRFRGIREGEGKITFVYKRPWNDETAKTRVYKVKVSKKLKVRLKEIKAF